jgi:hypothetical protein
LIRIGKKVKYGVLAVLFLISGFPLFSQEQAKPYTPDTQYVDGILKKAKVLGLSRDPYWLRLLHYSRGVVGLRSIVDDEAFFLSREGKYSADKELEATLRAYFTPVNPDTIHPGVKFIARFDWLNQKLDIDKAKLPFDFLLKFDEFYKKIDPGKAILVFPAGYINSPASMYGHTLLVIEPKSGNRLVALAVNYAAKTNETFGPIFAFKGLFGMYNGYYSILQYYDKINEYSSGEMRDMWEYTLNLNESELKRVLMHIVEMEKIGSKYFFLDENCSYNLLGLLEVARPGVNLTSHFIASVEPIDTLRVVIQEGLVAKREYRPSLYAQLMRKASMMSDRETYSAIAFADGDIDGNELSREAARGKNPACVYDLATDYLKFLGVKDQISQDDYRKRILDVLKRRSALPPNEQCVDNGEIPPPPETAHRSNKLSATYGRYASQHFFQLAYRPTCHDLIDSDLGMTPDNEMVFVNTVVRYYSESKKLKLQNFDLLKIVSLPSINRFYTPNCIMGYAGLKQSPVPKGEDSLTGYLDFGGGYSVSFTQFFHIYGLFQTNLNFSDKYRYDSLSAFGGKAGIISDFFDVWKSHIYGEALYVPWGNRTPVYRVGTQQRLKISSYVEVTGEFLREYIFNHHTNEISGSAHLLF